MATAASHSGDTWRVLLVDDHDDTREGYATYLRCMGVDVEVASDGLELVEAARRLVPDVIVTDLSMPRMDGWQALRVLKQDPRTCFIPVVAITAEHGRGGEARRAQAAGFDGFCAKPCPPCDLLSAIHGALQGPQPRADERPPESARSSTVSSATT
jgi:two-component system cell cycle response regulator DivK